MSGRSDLFETPIEEGVDNADPLAARIMTMPAELPCDVIARTDTPEFANETEGWHRIRTTGIGGSDVLALFGESTYKSKYSVWHEKHGDFTNQSGSEAAELGKHYERSTAELYAKRTNSIVVCWPVILRSKAYPFMIATLDFLICNESTQYPRGVVSDHHSDEPPEGITAGLEVKTTGLATRGFAEQWEDNNVPTGYALQTRHYHVVTGIERWFFAALVGNVGLVIRERLFVDPRRDQTLIDEEAAFWLSVQENRPPDPDGSDSTFATLKGLYPTHVPDKEIDFDEIGAQAVLTYETLGKEIKALDQLRDDAKAVMIDRIGEAEAAMFGGKKLFTYKRSTDSTAIDVDALKINHPDLVPELTIVKPGSRRIYVVQPKKEKK